MPVPEPGEVIPPAPAGPSRPRGQRSPRLGLLALALLVLAVAVGFAVVHGAQAVRAYRRLSAPRPPEVNPASIRDFVPLGAVARRAQVPEPVLEDALRSAGFTVQPQQAAPDVPGPPGVVDRLRRWLFGPPGSPPPPGAPSPPPPSATAASGGRTGRIGPPGRERRTDGLLDPDQQTLRQIARFSGRSPREAVRVVQDAVRAYRGVAPSGAGASPPVSAVPPVAPPAAPR